VNIKLTKEYFVEGQIIPKGTTLILEGAGDPPSYWNYRLY